MEKSGQHDHNGTNAENLGDGFKIHLIFADDKVDRITDKYGKQKGQGHGECGKNYGNEQINAVFSDICEHFFKGALVFLVFTLLYSQLINVVYD